MDLFKTRKDKKKHGRDSAYVNGVNLETNKGLIRRPTAGAPLC